MVSLEPAAKIGNNTTTNSKSKEYSYTAPQPSILFKHVLNPFYDFVASFYPHSWIPNWITAFGVSCTLLASFLYLLVCCFEYSNNNNGNGEAYSYSFAHVYKGFIASTNEGRSADIPGGFFIYQNQFFWVLIACGALNLIYTIADNTDGKQARRTRRSSPIGEYLDHGLDCVTSLLSTFMMISCLGESFAVAAFVLCVIATVTLFSHLLNFRRGIFVWGNSIVSVDEAMIGFGLAPIVIALWPAIAEYTMQPYINLPYRMTSPILPIFLLFQIKMIYDLCARAEFSIVFEKSVLFLLAIFASLFTLAYIQEGGTRPEFLEQGIKTRQYVHSVYDSSIGNFMYVGKSMLLGSGDVKAVAPTSGFVFYLLQVHDFTESVISLVLVSGVSRMAQSYVAQWVVTCATLCSIVIHCPIGGKCRRLEEPDYVPVAGAVFVICAFGACPFLGTVIAVIVHGWQIWRNVSAIQTAHALKKK